MFCSIRHRILRFVLCAVLGAPAACTITPDPQPDDPAYAPVTSLPDRPTHPNPGGIYHAGSGISLYEDRRALRIGDILTVVLSERTASSKTAETEISKENDISLEAGPVMGVVPSYGNYNMETGVAHDRDFEAEAESDQSNSLQGSIAVTVADILPNGLLVIRGEKWMTFSRGDEFIRIRGLVRPEDVGPDNTIPSTRIADARIAYSGTGELAEAGKQGWLSRFFTSEYWPF